MSTPRAAKKLFAYIRTVELTYSTDLGVAPFTVEKQAKGRIVIHLIDVDIESFWMDGWLWTRNSEYDLK